MVHCPSCGAGLRFEITSQQMFCEHCQNRFDPKKLYDKMSDDAKTEKTFDSFVYLCPSCGGEIETTDKNDAVGFCPYCGGMYESEAYAHPHDLESRYKCRCDSALRKIPLLIEYEKESDKVGW